jgi:hypothetical protein
VRLLSSARTARGVLAIGLFIVTLATVTALLIYTTGGHRPATGSGAGTAGASADPGGSYPVDPLPSGSVSASPSGSVHPSASASVPAAPPPAVPPPPPPTGPGAGWALRWAPDPARDGLGAFEGIEDDRANTDTGHMPHIFVAHSGANAYWEVEMPAWNQEHDTSTDRQRNEVKGMHAGGTNLALLPGQTWRLDWSLYVSKALQGTDHFTHIMQLKMPGNGSAPLFTMDLSLSGGVPTIALKVFAGGRTVGSTRLAPLQNTWIQSSVTFSVAAAPGGSVGWVLRDQNGAVLVNSTVTGVGTYVPSEGDRVRPKWGIYRSLLSNHADLVPCAMYMDNMRGYQKS